MNIREHIALAKRILDSNPPDEHLANYVLRDQPEVEAAGLSDLVWALHKDGNVHRNDVLGVIEHLEQYLKEVDSATSI